MEKFLIKVSRRMFYLVTVINRSLSLVLTFKIWTFNMSLHKQVNKSLPFFFLKQREYTHLCRLTTLLNNPRSPDQLA